MKNTDKAKRGKRKSAKPPVRVTVRRRAKEKIMRAEEAFQRKERRLRALVEQTTDLVAVIDREGTCRYASPSFGPVLGYAPEELIGKDLFFLVYPDDLTDARRALAIRVESGGAASNPMYVRIRHSDGSWRLQEAIGNNLLDDPAVQGIVISSRDITHRRRVEMALSESEEHYHTLFNAIDEGFCVIEVIFGENEKPIDYRYLEINPSFEKQTGLIDALGKRMRELAPKHEEYWFEIYGKVALTGEPIRFVKWSEQLHRWYDVYAFRVGKPEDRRVAVLFSDITERKRAEEALRRQNEFLVAMQDTTYELVAQFDLKKLLENIVNRAGTLMGTSLGFLDLVDPASNQLMPQVAVGALAGMVYHAAQLGEGISGAVWQTGKPLVVQDYDQWAGRLGNFVRGTVGSLIGVPLLSGTRVLGVLGLGHEYASPRRFEPEAVETLNQFARLAAVAVENARLFSNLQAELIERKRREEELRESHDQMRALTVRLDRVAESERRELARELHDRVGQNLTALNINLNIIRNQLSEIPAATARLDDSLTLVAETIERARDVMGELHPPVLDDYGLFAALRWHGERFSKRTDIATLFEGEELLPRLAPEVESALFRVALEALTNVAKHANAKTVTLKLGRADASAHLIITDDGVGFDPAGDAPHGWGIITMRERAGSVGGRMRVESTPGKGTRVVVEVGRGS